MEHNLALKSEERYIYKDYITWNDIHYWELIDGVSYNMAPPSRRHQDISGELHRQFANYLFDKTCKVYNAPFGVRFPVEGIPDDYIKNAVLPDIVVVCDRAKLDNEGCRGTPDLIIEILSPSTRKIDLEDKRDLYEKSGVKEYWIVDPFYNTVQVYILQNNEYKKPKIYTDEDKIKVSIFSDMEIDLFSVFKE